MTAFDADERWEELENEGRLVTIDIGRAAESLAGMIAEWYGNAPLPNARISAVTIATRLSRFERQTPVLLASQSTPAPEMGELVERLTKCADYIDDIKSRTGANTIMEEGAQKLFREAAAAISVGWRSIPEGWRLVPVEPTPEMLGAWYRYKNGHRWPGEEPARDTSDTGAYAAMLAAAPLPAQGEQG